MSFIPTHDAICCQRCGLWLHKKELSTVQHLRILQGRGTYCNKLQKGSLHVVNAAKRAIQKFAVLRIGLHASLHDLNRRTKPKKQNARGSSDMIWKSPAQMSISRWCLQGMTKIVGLQSPKRFEMSDLSLPYKFEFPDLKSLCIDTITEILENRLPGTRSNEYHQFIDEHQGVHEITESLLELVSSEIRGLEGREVSRTTLDVVRQKQFHDKLWDQPMGYASVVTDGRLPAWWRMLWLARKVFGEDDDIDKIQILGGSLTRGLLMVLHALPRRNVGEQVKPLSRRPHHSEGLGVKRVRVHESFDSENFKKMKEMLQDCVQKREEAIAERLSSLPIDIPESVKLCSIGKGQPQMTTTIGSFLQLGDEEAKSVTEMQSWLAHRQSEAMVLNQELLSSEDNKYNLMSMSSCEARVEDLAPLMDNAITTGFLDSAIDPAPSLGDTLSNRIS
ncbi:uncharacterized protein ASPGLDRAFT_55365 [Aspergillus glaucus CBS 516.65]|uniref:Uncharacterized protein n=1 Tax=Aspergillus glaucus CBS 516.65 TaxID=1160497 RepID=A0A1L9VW43_ASPGL|nr:hypothetical protein ASPGLDRAFT_55365 [Aspergillus glaucus CBS 516.65]OJJ88131.1 hypothetical protein ASPGLDRAFT_55365 [Aspergillus glaucus CBS 516.65]